MKVFTIRKASSVRSVPFWNHLQGRTSQGKWSNLQEENTRTPPRTPRGIVLLLLFQGLLVNKHEQTVRPTASSPKCLKPPQLDLPQTKTAVGAATAKNAPNLQLCTRLRKVDGYQGGRHLAPMKAVKPSFQHQISPNPNFSAVTRIKAHLPTSHC